MYKICRLMRKKNNKGFSLAELLVTIAVFSIIMTEIAALMINCSKLYLNGAREVELQSEAQQIIQQLEDLMIDAKVSINSVYDASISSDRVITISADEYTTYSISFNRTDLTQPYGNLYYSETVSGSSVDNILMAEYVESVSLNYSNLSENNIITLHIKMRNDQYTYETSKDIFNRNMIGTGPGKRGLKNNGQSDKQVEVLRYGRTCLNDACFEEIMQFESDNPGTYTYSFEWKDPTSQVGGLFPSSLYTISTNGANTYAACNISNMCGSETLMKKAFPRASDPDVSMYCYATPAGDTKKIKVCEFSLYTAATKVGLGISLNKSPYGYAIGFPNGTKTTEHIGAICMEGVDPAYCKSIIATPRILEFDTHGLGGMTDPDDIADAITNVSYNGVITRTIDGYKPFTYDIPGASGEAPVIYYTTNASGGDIDWMHEMTKILKPGSTSDYYNFQDRYNLMKMEPLGYTIDTKSNSLFLKMGRMCPDSSAGYYKSMREGYLMEIEFKMEFFNEQTPMEFQVFFFPATGASDAQMQENLELFYTMISKVPKN